MELATDETRSEAARLMGSARTAKKAAAAKVNAVKGGRPKGFIVSEETRRKMSEGIRRAKARKSGEAGL